MKESLHFAGLPRRIPAQCNSATVRDLIVGSDIVLDDRGTHPLRGVEGTWQLFEVVGP